MALGLSPSEIVKKGDYQLLEIADHWERVRLSDIADVQNGYAFKSEFFDRERGVPLIRIRDITNTETEHRYHGDYEDRYLVRKGDILIGMDGDFVASRWQGRQGLLNQRVCKLTIASSGIDERFFFLCLQPYLDAINAETSSVTVKHLSSRTVEAIPLPLPPLAEQRRLVGKIEKLFSELDNGIENLETARQQLSVYRQALLKQTFEGKLTKQWREENAPPSENELVNRLRKDALGLHEQQLERWKVEVAQWEKDERTGRKPSRPRKPTPVRPIENLEGGELPSLPDGWAWFRLGDISEVSGGLTKNPKRQALPRKLRYLRVANVYADEIFTDEIHEIGVTDSEAHKVTLQPGDLLMVEGNGSITQIGRVAMWSGEVPDCGHQNHLIRVRLSRGAVPRFLLHFLLSPVGRDQIVREASSTSGLYTLSLTKVSHLPVPVTTRAEEAEIVSQLDAQLSIVDKLLEEIAVQVARSTVLRHTILKRAFTGELVHQDPADEPASLLLERIQAERSNAEKKKRKTGT